MRRDDLIRDLWPDKMLYGCTLLVVAAATGALAAIARSIVPLEVAADVPRFLLGWAPETTVALSAATAVLAVAALAHRDTRFAFAGAALAVLTFGLFGLGSLLAVVAGGFLVQARREDEHLNPVARHLSRRMWPDKSLAASLVLVVASVLSLAWGVALLAGWVAPQASSARVLGPLALLAAALAGSAAWTLYHQRAPWLGAAAALATMACAALWVVGPLLGTAALVLVTLAWREKEFDRATRQRLHGEAVD